MTGHPWLPPHNPPLLPLPFPCPYQPWYACTTSFVYAPSSIYSPSYTSTYGVSGWERRRGAAPPPRLRSFPYPPPWLGCTRGGRKWEERGAPHPPCFPGPFTYPLICPSPAPSTYVVSGWPSPGERGGVGQHFVCGLSHT
uniref:Uncharacterized protein n=1 Tax=Morchella importuna TaxID=1174673 RepID=A0A650AG01_9PEZI|nr:hypothetical protein [Morchella importuna]QGN66678.1 hypothetical protein [Morchella importuna]